MLQPKSYADYWVKALALLAGEIGLFVVFGFLQMNQFWNLLIIAIAIAQTLLVYRMLKITGRSMAILMISFISVPLGPSIDFGNRSLFLSQLIYLFPMIIAGLRSSGSAVTFR